MPREGDFACCSKPSRKECKALFAELLGMMLFVFVGVGTAMFQFRDQVSPSAGDASLLTTALAFGLGITTFVCMIAGVSGGHLNPAVTFCLMALQEISPSLGFLYVLMQMCGACLGALLAALADPHMSGFATNVVIPYFCGAYEGRWGTVAQCCERFDCNVAANEGTPAYNTSAADDPAWYYANLNSHYGYTADPPLATNSLMWGPAFVVEFVGTFMLCLTVLLTAVYKGSVAGNLAPLAIGLSVFFAHLIAIPITNCSINPARSFGAAVVASILPYYNDGELSYRMYGAWEQQAFFWAVPIAGGLLAALVFWLAFLEAGNEDGKKTGYDLNPAEPNRGDGQGTDGATRRRRRSDVEQGGIHRRRSAGDGGEAPPPAPAGPLEAKEQEMVPLASDDKTE